MKLASLNKLTLLDYPGKVACIMFTQGCNFCCPFCQNSTLIKKNGEEEISEKELFDYLNKRKKILDGICISGGEPLMHDDIDLLIERIKDLGYKVKLDTNGSYPEHLQKLIDHKLIDYVAMDIKNDFKKYNETSGTKNIDIDKIKKSIKILKESNIDYEFRTTIIKEFHTVEDIKKISEYIGKDAKYYIQNYQDSENVLMKGLHGFSHDELEDIEKLRQIYPNLSVRGL